MAIKREEFASESTHKGRSFAASLNSENLGLVIDHLVRNYTNPDLAVLREWVSNGHDAHVEAGVEKAVEVTLPTKFSPQLIVQDFGDGMSQKHVEEIYSKFHATSKEGNQDVAGGIGIGGKSALALAPQYLMTSIHEGHKTIYMFERDNNIGMKVNILVDNVPTEEPNGVRVEVTVKNMAEFNIENIERVLWGWTDEQVTVLNMPGDATRTTVGNENLQRYEKGFLTSQDSVGNTRGYYSYRPSFDLRVIIGCVNYTVNISNELVRDNIGGDAASMLLPHSRRMGIFVKPGVLTLPSSREVIELSTGNLKVILGTAVELVEEVTAELQSRLDAAPSHKAAIELAETAESFIWSANADRLTYKGDPIPNPQTVTAEQLAGDSTIATFMAHSDGYYGNAFKVYSDNFNPRRHADSKSFLFVFDNVETSLEMARSRVRAYVEKHNLFTGSRRESITFLAVTPDYPEWVEAVGNFTIVGQAELDKLLAEKKKAASGGGMGKQGALQARVGAIDCWTVGSYDDRTPELKALGLQRKTHLGAVIEAAEDDAIFVLEDSATSVNRIKDWASRIQDEFQTEEIEKFIFIRFPSSRTTVDTLNKAYPGRFISSSASYEKISAQHKLQTIASLPDEGIVLIRPTNLMDRDYDGVKRILKNHYVRQALPKAVRKTLKRTVEFRDQVTASQWDNLASGDIPPRDENQGSALSEAMIRVALYQYPPRSVTEGKLVAQLLKSIVENGNVLTREAALAKI